MTKEPEFHFRKLTPAENRAMEPMMRATELISHVGEVVGREGDIDLENAIEALKEGYHEGETERVGSAPGDPGNYLTHE